MTVRALARSPVTVGREPELSAIGAAVDDARGGRGGLLFLVGEAGSGKTRLLREAEAHARAAGLAVLTSDAPAVVAPPPYALIAGALRSWIRENGPHPDALASFAPGLRHVLPEWPAGPETDFPPDQMRLLVLEAALQAFLLAARPSGAVVILDDLHNADPETLAFLTHASSSIERHGLLIVGALRPGVAAADAETRALVGRGRAAVLDVTPLDSNAASALVEALLGAEPPAGFVDEVLARTDGVPLLVEELLEAHIVAGTVRKEGRGVVWERTDRRVLPKTILEIVRNSMWRLSEDARRCIGAASVLGGPDVELLLRITELDGTTLTRALEEATDAGLLDLSGAFRHALIMEAAYESLVAAHRFDLHRRAADSLAADRGEDPAWYEERARHLAAVGQNEAAAELLHRAALRDLGSSAPASAVAVLERALELDPSGDIRARLRDSLAEALTTLGRWEDALVIDREDHSSVAVNPTRLARMAHNSLMAGRLDDADDLIASARQAGGEPGSLSALSALVALWRGDLETAVERGRDTVKVGERTENWRVVCEGLDVVGRASDALSRRDEAVETFRRWIEISEREGLTASHLQAMMELANVEYMARANPEPLREVRARARNAGAYQTLVLADLSLTWCLGLCGELLAAIDAASEAVDVCGRFGLGLLPHALIALGWALGRKHPDSGNAFLSEALALAPEDHDVAINGIEAFADSAYRAGRVDEACDRFGEVVEIMRANPSAVPAMTPFVRPSILMLAGKELDAREAREIGRNLVFKSIVSYNEAWFRVSEALIEGSDSELDEALQRLAAMAPAEGALARIIAAQVRGGTHAPAWLRDAIDTLDRSGAETDAARARSVLRGLGERVPRARRRKPDLPAPLVDRGVTKREAQVLELLGRGLSNPEIAAALYLSVRTVESHVSALLQKLGAEGRAGLIAFSLSLDGPSG